MRLQQGRTHFLLFWREKITNKTKKIQILVEYISQMAQPKSFSHRAKKIQTNCDCRPWYSMYDTRQSCTIPYHTCPPSENHCLRNRPEFSTSYHNWLASARENDNFQDRDFTIHRGKAMKPWRVGPAVTEALDKFHRWQVGPEPGNNNVRKIMQKRRFSRNQATFGHVQMIKPASQFGHFGPFWVHFNRPQSAISSPLGHFRPAFDYFFGRFRSFSAN